MKSQEKGYMCAWAYAAPFAARALLCLAFRFRSMFYTGLTASVLMLAAAQSPAAEDLVGDANAAPLSLIDEARQARAAGDPATALVKLEAMLSGSPDNVDALVQLGFTQLALENTASAEQAFAMTLRLAPDYVDATLGLAYVAFRRSQLQEAERLAAAVLDAAPDHASARTLLNATKAAQQASVRIPSKRPLANPLALTPQSSPQGRIDTVAPDMQATPRPAQRRAFVSIGSGLGPQRDFEVSNVLEVRKSNGSTVVFAVRLTSREYGEAIQLRFSTFRQAGDLVYGVEVGAAQGADNFARALLGGSVEGRLPSDLGVHARVRLEKFPQAGVLTLASRLTKSHRSGLALSLGLTTSIATNIGGHATVIDARAKFPMSDSTAIQLGVGYGEELDGDRMRDLRTIAIGLAHEVNDDLTIMAALTSEPGKKRLDLTFARRF